MSKWFHEAEFSCHDGSPVPDELLPNLHRLMSQLDIIRDRWGGPMRVVSGWRSPEWNTRVRGAKLSQHLNAAAADIQPIVKAAALPAAVLRMREMVDALLVGRSAVNVHAGRLALATPEVAIALAT